MKIMGIITSRAFANISEILGNIKFPESLQP